MNSLPSERDPFEQLAEAFLARYRAGERPSVSAYAEQHPEMAEQIRELLPALVVMEELRPGKGGPAVLGAGKVSDASKVPQQLGEYRILREVGRGGMGVVYEAVQESLGRHVALKVLPFNSLISPTHLERFRREARAAARLHHTNIVPVFGVGEHDGIHYYAMQFIQGQGLDLVLQEVQRLRGPKEAPTVDGRALARSVAEGLVTGQFSCAAGRAGGVSPLIGAADQGAADQGAADQGAADQGAADQGAADQGADAPRSPSDLPRASASHSEITSQSQAEYFRSVARVGVQVAEALEYAHHQGVLHRDIKPSNLLLDTAGTVWVTDFGLAKAEDSDELTKPGDVVGTLRYMAPERFEGSSDPRSDVYSLGLTLYELLTLRPALDDSHRARLIERVKQENPTWPSKIDRRIPRDLETIVLKAIAKEPAGRYATAEALAEDLRRFLADRPIRARRTPLLERAWRLCRRNPVVAILTASVAFLVAVIALVASVSAVFLGQEAHRAREAERDATEKLWLSLRDQARASQKAGQRFESLKVVKEAIALGQQLQMPAGRFHELRNIAIASLVLPDVAMDDRSIPWPSGSVGLDFDDRLEHYARSDQQGAVSVRRVSDDVEIASPLPGSGSPTGPFLSPDGRFLATFVPDATNSPLKLWKLVGEQPAAVIEEPANAGGAFDFSPDSRQLAIGHKDGTISVYDLASGQLLHRLKTDPISQHASLKFHPQRPLLAVGGRKSVQILDLESGKVLAELPHPKPCYQVAWHPDGKTLATACEDRKIYLWDVPTRKRTLVLEGHRVQGIGLAFNHAGDLLASNDWHAVLRLWDTRTGRQVFSMPAATACLRFSPDDRLLGAEVKGEKVRLLRVAPGRELRTLVRRPDSPGLRGYGKAAFEAGGRLLAALATDGHEPDGIVFVDLARGDEVAFLPMDNPRHVTFDQSGTLLTAGAFGLVRWPARSDPAVPGSWRLGPPQLVPQFPSGELIGVSNDGRVLAFGRHSQGSLVLHLDRPSRPILLSPQDDVRFCAVSPDGRWAATGSHSTTDVYVKVWDADTGQLVKDLPVRGGAGIGFSPDGQWLATPGDGCRLWAVGSWEEGPPVGGGHSFAFSPDGKILAVGEGFGAVRLVDPNTGKEYARLEAPVQSRLLPQCFTPDGARLITWALEDLALHVWDLRAIGEQLAELGLEWDLPPFVPVKPGKSVPPLRVKLDLGNDFHFLPGGYRTSIGLNSFLLALNPFNFQAYLQRGRAYGRLGESQKAIADYSTVLALVPPAHKSYGEALFRRSQNYKRLEDLSKKLADLQKIAELDLDLPLELQWFAAQEYNDLARHYVTGPEKQRDPSKALPLAQKAVKLAPDLSVCWNTLGVVYYRLGKYAEAMEKLEHSLRECKGEAAAFDLFFLAMCHARRGDAAKAKDRYERALHWVQEQQGKLQPGWKEELDAFRAEADTLLAQPAKP